MPPIPYQTPAWLDPSQASVLDPWWKKGARSLGRLAGLDDPNSQVLGMIGMLETGAVKGPARKAIEKAIKAYHGSPHSFEKFAAEKIGTGQGAQSFGHGHYVAEEEAVARTYRPEGGHMYEVAVKAHPEDFLDLDKPLNQQSASVQQAIDQFHAARGDNLVLPDEPGSTFQDRLVRVTGSPDKAAEMLREFGIAGIRYLDQGSRGIPDPALLKTRLGQAGAKGMRPRTYNYVVFPGNESLIDISRKYGIPLAVLTGGGGATLGNLGQKPLSSPSR